LKLNVFDAKNPECRQTGSSCRPSRRRRARAPVRGCAPLRLLLRCGPPPPPPGRTNTAAAAPTRARVTRSRAYARALLCLPPHGTRAAAMAQSIEEWYKSMPVVTRTYLTVAFLTTAACALDVRTHTHTRAFAHCGSCVWQLQGRRDCSDARARARRGARAARARRARTRGAAPFAGACRRAQRRAAPSLRRWSLSALRSLSRLLRVSFARARPAAAAHLALHRLLQHAPHLPRAAAVAPGHELLLLRLAGCALRRVFCSF
jgi:hypothetical protein